MCFGVKIKAHWSTGPDFFLFESSEKDLKRMREYSKDIPKEVKLKYDGLFTDDKSYLPYMPGELFTEHILTAI